MLLLVPTHPGSPDGCVYVLCLLYAEPTADVFEPCIAWLWPFPTHVTCSMVCVFVC